MIKDKVFPSLDRDADIPGPSVGAEHPRCQTDPVPNGGVINRHMGINNVAIKSGRIAATVHRQFMLVERRNTRVYTEYPHVCTVHPRRYRMPNDILSHSREREIHLDTGRLHPGSQTARSSARDERRSSYLVPRSLGIHTVWLKTSGTESIKEHQKFCIKLLLFLMFEMIPTMFNALDRFAKTGLKKICEKYLLRSIHCV